MKSFKTKSSIVLGILFGVGICSAESAEVSKPSMEVSTAVNYRSRHVAHGFDFIGNEATVEGTIYVNHVLIENLKLVYTVTHVLDRDHDLWDERGPAVRYSRSFFTEDRWALAGYAFAYYWMFPNQKVESNRRGEPISKETLQGLKLQTGWSLPKLYKVGNVSIVPSYTAVHWTPSKDDMFKSGTQHEFGLAAQYPLSIVAGASLELKGTANYHDGVLGVEEGWSHDTLMLGISVPCLGFMVVSSVNYQWSHEPTMNPDDERWFSIMLGKRF